MIKLNISPPIWVYTFSSNKWGIIQAICETYNFVYVFSVVAQSYNTYAHEVHVILGNSALVKCDIPSFVADFVSVVSWIDNNGNEYFHSKLGTFSIHHLGYTSNFQAYFKAILFL